jgi:hypothetical protein
MKHVLIGLVLCISLFFLSCDTSTEPELKTQPTGVWQLTSGAAFNYLVLFEDNTFLYAENDLTVSEPEENGLEVGTYSHNAETGDLSFNVSYDDNDPGNDSGVGDIGVPVTYDAVVSNEGSTLSLAGGALVLSAAIADSSSPITGAWSKVSGIEFNYLLLFADNTFLYAENDLDAESPEENGLEVGTYSYNADSGNITFNITYDDNDPGNDSGVGDIGTPVVIDAVLSNENMTLSIASGELVLTREF